VFVTLSTLLYVCIIKFHAHDSNSSRLFVALLAFPPSKLRTALPGLLFTGRVNPSLRVAASDMEPSRVAVGVGRECECGWSVERRRALSDRFGSMATRGRRIGFARHAFWGCGVAGRFVAAAAVTRV
jgi:hypothetical protein